jgi:hypothetical protein
MAQPQISLRYVLFTFTAFAVLLAFIFQSHNKWDAAAHGFPPLFVLVRDYRNVSRGDLLIRAALAALCFWIFLVPATAQDVDEWLARETDPDKLIGDTGDNVAAAYFGWFPGMLWC